MKLFTPTPHKRLNEATGFVLLSTGLLLWLSLISYRTQDPSWNTATGSVRPGNLIGYAGSYLADLFLQTFGLSAFVFPIFAVVLAWRWLRSEAVSAAGVKMTGTALLILSAGAALSLGPRWMLFGGVIHPGGAVGMLTADYLASAVNLTGAMVLTATSLILSIYLISTFTLDKLAIWLAPPARGLASLGDRWKKWIASLQRKAIAKAPPKSKRVDNPAPRMAAASRFEAQPEPELAAEIEDIPICPLEDTPPWNTPASVPVPAPAQRPVARPAASQAPEYVVPSTDLLNVPAARTAFDEQELKDIAVKVKSKFEEFNVLGSVVQINPGPVVTTFEFKPEAGIKYSRMTTLTEDLCLGLQAESILIERIPGKPTVGIEVPNTRREVISLRQILESDEFQKSASHLTISLGKDINGRIKVAALDTMPHLLIAGSTGAGKSVMINSMIMSILYKATPDEVRLIMIDPKRLELGLYEGIPHLLTPVITDPKKATNALRNAVLEMERRLRLLAEQGVRSIDQYNKKIRKLQSEPRSLFTDDEEVAIEELRPLPYILILIDELADLMMLEGHNVEESVTRLAQMP